PLTSFDTQSLAVQRFAPDTGDFINRTPGSTPAESQAEWTQISIRHTVGSGVPEIGHPIGVAFWAAADGAVDDAILTRSSETVLLILQVNTITGATKLMNTTGAPIDIDYYEILSTGAALNSIAWNSLQDQDYEGNGVPGTGNGWEEAGNVGSSVLAESYLQGSSMIDDAETISLGNAFDPSVFGAGNDGDLVFHYGLTTGILYSGLVVYDDTPGQDQADFDSDGDIDGADFLAWQNGFGMTGTATRADGDANGDTHVDSADLDIWKDQFGTGGSVSDLTGQAVPEPNAFGLFTLILAGMGIGFTQLKK
ncbi:MAG: hypothetical protein JW829_07430, partial [Pirellulales bacterium]|nr:hypothetical protein [Pirellulales bacterium]